MSSFPGETMEKKYELIDATAEGAYANKGKVYRIRALRDIDIVNRGGAYKFRAGDLGGLISGEHNLSQEGDCWIDSTSVVFENARIEGDALVLKSSKVTSNATVKGNAPVISSVITDSAVVEDICVSNCAIYNNAKATGNVFYSHVSLRITLK